MRRLLRSLFLALLCLQSQATLTVIASNDTFTSRAAAFGPKFPSAGQIGYLLEPMDPSGCHKVKPPISNWIALVHRGGCSFVTKVRTMQQSGAVGVVIGDMDQQHWVTMYAPDGATDISIPSIFLAQREYKSLLYLTGIVARPMLVYVKHDDFSWPLFDLFIVIFAGPSIMIMFMYCIYKFRNHQRKLQDIAPIGVVSKLALISYSVGDKNTRNESDCCAICLEEYYQGEQLRLLPCKHSFHPNCVDPWLTTQKKYCPLCKTDV
ncbi:hypothetical protein DM01DRAFT_1385423 [Hesseltinella vesiculosa]|uniref:RING-type E3 ubiquitin transferase n=1 Tax=Hesseltinella vesiculosa TaxID=101127 RepID=A0A1X2GA73_9FUNG|nr:hypothetical protein DM01DRAFT_1385423 [Hesseltinella vesiculosa]